jgi:hypothetical protein
MKKHIPRIIAYFFFIFFIIDGHLFGLGEKTLLIGGEASWDALENRQGVAEVPDLRPYPVLALSSARSGRDKRTGAGAFPDLALSFDEERPDLFADAAGHYTVLAAPTVSVVDRRWARAGKGAARFSGSADTEITESFRGPLVVSPRGGEGLFAENRDIADFTLEFWLYPMTMGNGEQILTWSASRQTRGGAVFQRIQCAAARNRLGWTFVDFFTPPGGDHGITLNLEGITPLSPRVWSHHLIRFDAATGLLEYLVNGSVEAVVYAAAAGREGGEVCPPVTGEGSALVLGGRYTGLIDEFRIYGAYVETPALEKYPPQGGRAETRLLDLGPDYGPLLRVEASGGRSSAAGGRLINQFSGDRSFRFPDDSALHFFIRLSPGPAIPADTEWIPLEPGRDLPGKPQARFVQIAVLLYPSGDGETSPYLESLRLVYQPQMPPQPPSQVTAIARDGAVDLSWKPSADKSVEGYLVYYGTAGGVYFGDEAFLGPSPINAGKRNSLRIDGLTNGVLYYFSVAAYDRLDPLHSGAFSREVTARPLKMPE